MELFFKNKIKEYQHNPSDELHYVIPYSKLEDLKYSLNSDNIICLGCTDWISDYINLSHKTPSSFNEINYFKKESPALLLPLDGLNKSIYIKFIKIFLPEVNFLGSHEVIINPYRAWEEQVIYKKIRNTISNIEFRKSNPLLKRKRNCMILLPEKYDKFSNSYWMHIVFNRHILRNPKRFNKMAKLILRINNDFSLLKMRRLDIGDINIKSCIEQVNFKNLLLTLLLKSTSEDFYNEFDAFAAYNKLYIDFNKVYRQLMKSCFIGGQNIYDNSVKTTKKINKEIKDRIEDVINTRSTEGSCKKLISLTQDVYDYIHEIRKEIENKLTERTYLKSRKNDKKEIKSEVQLPS